MEVPPCAVGRLDPDGPWIGFAPTLDDGYALTIGSAGARVGEQRTRSTCWPSPSSTSRTPVTRRPRSLRPPTATSVPSCAMPRSAIDDVAQRQAADESVDAIDDGLAADVVIERLERAVGDGVDAVDHLRHRVAPTDRRILIRRAGGPRRRAGTVVGRHIRGGGFGGGRADDLRFGAAIGSGGGHGGGRRGRWIGAAAPLPPARTSASAGAPASRPRP